MESSIGRLHWVPCVVLYNFRWRKCTVLLSMIVQGAFGGVCSIYTQFCADPGEGGHPEYGEV
jgi:hypothetical protein